MSKDKKQQALVPRLRFPKFRDASGWEQKPLGVLTDPINERVGDTDSVPYTVTSGEGLISQEEKYGRTIAGKSLKNYYRLQRNDFAFNKSATKSFPQGYIARLQSDERAAVPNSIFTCFRIVDENVDAAYLDYLFQANLHGRWLMNYITVGARAHGALNISDDDLYALPVPLPIGDKSFAEQRTIAECLGSLDDWIVAEGLKLAKLRDHKKGLMQQLFPREGESRPRLRFPGFRARWSNDKLGAIAEFVRDRIPVSEIAPEEYISTENILPEFGGVTLASNLPPTGSVTQFKANDILLSNIRPYLKKAWVADRDGGASNDVIVIRAKLGLVKRFVSFVIKNESFINYIMASAKGVKMPRGDVSLMKEYLVSWPEPEEQQRIADCLASLDALIFAQVKKLGALRTHKRGLMRQLFPSPEDAEA